MGVRGMIINERVEQVLGAAVRDVLSERPRARWASPEELASALPCLSLRDDGSYEVIPLGAIAAIDEVRLAAERAGVRFGQAGLAYRKTA